jgi:hypothetical protein
MMNPRRCATVAAVLCETAFVACLVGVGSAGTQSNSAVATSDLQSAPLTADAAPATAISSVVADSVDLAVDTATVAESVTATNTAAAPKEPKTIVEAALTEPSQTPPPETSPVQVATASTPDADPKDTKDAVSSIEILGECLVADPCIDQYLWALYQRTPKEDTIMVDERGKVTVKR